VCLSATLCSQVAGQYWPFEYKTSFKENQVRVHIGIAVLMMATAVTAYGQATPRCDSDKVTDFNTERKEPFVGGVSTTVPTNPALFSLLPGLEGCPSGSPSDCVPLEVREKLVYLQREKAILLWTFVTASDSPFPTCTPGAFCTDEELEGTTVVEKATLGIDHTITSCSPLPSLMFVGTVTQQAFPRPGDTVYPGGWGVDITGATFALSTGFTTKRDPNPPGSDNNTGFSYDCATLYPGQPPLFNVTESVAGVGVAWAPCAVGTVTFGHEYDKDRDRHHQENND
jgi:hypothetical protein